MSARGGGIAGGPGNDVVDLKVCLNILKKTIVMFPVIIMLVIVLVRVTLTHRPEDDDDAHGANDTDGGGIVVSEATADHVQASAVATDHKQRQRAFPFIQQRNSAVRSGQDADSSSASPAVETSSSSSRRPR